VPSRLRALRWPLLVGCLLAALVALGTPAGAGPTGRCVLVAELGDVVNSGTAAHLVDGVAAAERRGCDVFLVVVDTPGGMLDATRVIVQTFLTAPVPVVTYVAPAGARAGSAGMFITLAGHVAAMAPGSNIGAAHPVMLGGGDPERGGGEHMARKVENDTAAFARAIAERRERNVAWAEAAVRDSASATAVEAEEQRVIDLVAPSRRALLEALDGRELQLESRRVVLSTRDAELVVHAMTIQQRVLAVLGNPNLTYALLMIGLLGLMIEFYNPGGVIGGLVGGLSLLLAAIGLNALPVTWGGIALIAVALALFAAELWVTSYGLLTLGGLGALLLGSGLLLDRGDPDFFADASVRLSWGVVLPLAAVIASATGLLASRAAKARKAPPATGREALIGAAGFAAEPIDSHGGNVSVLGERWAAVSDQLIETGAPIRVIGLKGLTLEVQPKGTKESS
jgi:membrane-bound serine protease (ClpP class)